jgi:hypothetical protein
VIVAVPFKPSVGADSVVQLGAVIELVAVKLLQPDVDTPLIVAAKIVTTDPSVRFSVKIKVASSSSTTLN